MSADWSSLYHVVDCIKNCGFGQAQMEYIVRAAQAQLTLVAGEQHEIELREPQAEPEEPVCKKCGREQAAHFTGKLYCSHKLDNWDVYEEQ